MTAFSNGARAIDSVHDPGEAELAQLDQLRGRFVMHHIFRRASQDRGVRYEAHALTLEQRPHTVITCDLAELRTALEQATSQTLAEGSLLAGHRRSYWLDLAAIQHVALAAGRWRATTAGRLSRTAISVAPAACSAPTTRATSTCETTFALFRQVGDRVSQARTSLDLAAVFEGQGQLGPALGYSRRALALFRAAGHRSGQADALNAVGWYQASWGTTSRPWPAASRR
jgi:hypothetical protein